MTDKEKALKVDKLIKNLHSRDWNAFEDKGWYARTRAAEALGRLGYKSDKVEQALLKALNDEDKYVKGKSAEALGNLGIKSDKVQQALVNAMCDDKDFVREQAKRAIMKLFY